MNREEARLRTEGRCWASIGVLGGDRSCPVLRECAHCRECDVIAVAADDLLMRSELPAVIPRISSRPMRTAESDDAIAITSTGKRLSVVTFDLSGQGLALEVARLVEVGVERSVRRVPHRTSAAFVGLVNVQGKLEPCFSLPAVLGLQAQGNTSNRRLLVVGDEERRCAFFADHVSLQEVDLNAVAEPPATVSAALDTHVRGILRLGGRPWSLLDADRLMATLEGSLG